MMYKIPKGVSVFGYINEYNRDIRFTCHQDWYFTDDLIINPSVYIPSIDTWQTGNFYFIKINDPTFQFCAVKITAVTKLN